MAYALIQKSGGFSHFADQKKVYIVRTLPDENKIKIPVDIPGIIDGSAKDVSLQPGDVVVVPEKFFSF